MTGPHDHPYSPFNRDDPRTTALTEDDVQTLMALDDREALRRLLADIPGMRQKVEQHADETNHSIGAGVCLDCDWTAARPSTLSGKPGTVQQLQDALSAPLEFAHDHHDNACLGNHDEAGCAAIVLGHAIADLMPRVEQLEAKSRKIEARAKQIEQVQKSYRKEPHS